MKHADRGLPDPQRDNILRGFALPAAVAARIVEDGDSHDHEALGANMALPLEAAVLIGETSRNYHALQSVLRNVPHPDVLHAVLSQRRETRVAVLRTIVNIWNMDEASQQQFVDRCLPDSVADMYLRTRRWFPEPAAKAVLRASVPVAVEYLAELADTDLNDDTLAEVAATIIETTENLMFGQQTEAARWLAEACWLRAVVKNAALNSDAATAVAALTQIGLTDGEAETTVNKLSNIKNPLMAGHAVKHLLTNPTVTTETRLLIAERYPAAAGDAAADGAHRPSTNITNGQQLRNVDELAVIDKAVSGTSTFMHLADLIEHPATTQDPHILRRLIKLSEIQAAQTGPIRRKLLAHITQMHNNDLPETFDKTTAARVWRRVQRQTTDCNAARDATTRKGTHSQQVSTGWAADTKRGSRRKPVSGKQARRAMALTQKPVETVERGQMHKLGQYWRDQLGEGDSAESAAAWQTALDTACAVHEQSSADIIKIVKTLGAGT